MLSPVQHAIIIVAKGFNAGQAFKGQVLIDVQSFRPHSNVRADIVNLILKEEKCYIGSAIYGKNVFEFIVGRP